MMDGLLRHTEPRLEKSAAAWAVVSLGLLEHTLTPSFETVAMFNMNLRYLIDHFKKGGFGWGYVRFVPVWFKTLTQSLSSWEGIFRQSHWFILFIIFCGLKTDGPAHTGSRSGREVGEADLTYRTHSASSLLGFFISSVRTITAVLLRTFKSYSLWFAVS